MKLLDRREADKLLSETSEVGRMLSSLLRSLLPGAKKNLTA
ncbi:MAG: hypothetical protein ABI024_14925 [Vicinamibacterales bacterium]